MFQKKDTWCNFCSTWNKRNGLRMQVARWLADQSKPRWGWCRLTDWLDDCQKQGQDHLQQSRRIRAAGENRTGKKKSGYWNKERDSCHWEGEREGESEGKSEGREVISKGSCIATKESRKREEPRDQSHSGSEEERDEGRWEGKGKDWEGLGESDGDGDAWVDPKWQCQRQRKIEMHQMWYENNRLSQDSWPHLQSEEGLNLNSFVSVNFSI